MEPTEYEAWYHTARGKWIAGIEWKLLLDLLQPSVGDTLLDVGCGTGYFSRRFANTGLSVTALDPNKATLTYACQQDGGINYLQANALSLPFSNDSFDYVSAITSLCFVEPPEQALREMWRVTRRGLLLGVLNKHSLLYWQKRHSKSYAGARWDRITTVKKWAENLEPEPYNISVSNGVLVAGSGKLSRLVERTLGSLLPFGAFIAMYIEKSPAKYNG
ncbi:MAG: class I SAM-dependent methyltransferase [Gammaproteobacteria bacterium]|nr:class I SAM-dependent methyltransferase [Gammaproteobacteria bacterium]